jgi:hypothetical protein
MEAALCQTGEPLLLLPQKFRSTPNAVLCGVSTEPSFLSVVYPPQPAVKGEASTPHPVKEQSGADTLFRKACLIFGTVHFLVALKKVFVYSPQFNFL